MFSGNEGLPKVMHMDEEMEKRELERELEERQREALEHEPVRNDHQQY